MDTTAVNVAVPSLAIYFGVLEADVGWTVIGYSLSLASALPASGWLANRFGAKNLFVTALAGFVVTSLLCGLAPTLPALIGFRMLKGITAGFLTPVGSAILFSAFPLAERARATTVVLGVVAIAPATGPIVGGALIELLDWRWIFFVNLPVGILALALSWSWMRDVPRAEAGGFDFAGFVLSFLGMGALLFGVSEGPSRGWTTPLVLGTAIGGSIALSIFVWRQLAYHSPLLNLRLMSGRLYRQCCAMVLPAYMSFIGLIFLMPLYLDGLRGFDALTTGLVMAPQPIGVVIGSQVVGRGLYKQIGPRRLLTGSMVTVFFVSVSFSLLTLNTPLPVVASMMFVRGLCISALFLGLQTAVYAKIDLPDMPQATTLYGLLRQAAPAFGVALAATWIAATGTDRTPGQPMTSTQQLETLESYQGGFILLAVPFLLAAIFASRINDDDAAATLAPS